MSNQTNGLRFDVYERVHLPDDVAAIDELEEIELVPRIQVIDQGDQAVLKGQLLLSGIYRGQNAPEGTLTLEHWIPVEISLPMNRVSRLDDISIEIDNFDVDLLSARTLNITGVLSLRGISVEPVEEQQSQRWEEDSFTAVHQREETEEHYPQYGDISTVSARADETAEIEELSENRDRQPEEQLQQPAYIEEEQVEQAGEEAREVSISSQQAGEDSWLQWEAHSAPEQPAEQFLQAQEEERADEPAEPARSPLWQPSFQAAPAQPLQAEQEEPLEQRQEPPSMQFEQEEQPEIYQQQEAQPEEPEVRQQEVQIAFSGKSSGDGSEGESGFGFRSILQSSKREQAAREAAEQQIISDQEAEDAARTNNAEEEIEWKKLFFSKQAEDNEFRKIRVCIVQKEETLEQIALRYQLNPRELLIHNRLHESAVEEGQLLYIP